MCERVDLTSSRPQLKLSLRALQEVDRLLIFGSFMHYRPSAKGKYRPRHADGGIRYAPQVWTGVGQSEQN